MSSDEQPQQGFTPGYWGQPTPSQFPPVELPASVQRVEPSLPCPDCEPSIDTLTPRQQGRIRFLRWLHDHGRVGGEHDE